MFSEWSEELHVSPNAAYDRRFPIALGFDFGCTGSSPFACVLLQEEPDLGRIRVFDEFFCAGVSTTEAAGRLDRWWDAKRYPRGETAVTAGDPAAKDARLHLEAESAGSGILAYGRVSTGFGSRSVEDGIETIRKLPQDQLLLIHSDCVRLRAEFGSYSWSPPVHDGGPERGPVKRDDHGLDALRYVLGGLRSRIVTYLHRPGEGKRDPALAVQFAADKVAREAHRQSIDHPTRRGAVPDLPAILLDPIALGHAARARAVVENGTCVLYCPLCDARLATGIPHGPCGDGSAMAWGGSWVCGCGRAVSLTVRGSGDWEVRLGRESAKRVTA